MRRLLLMLPLLFIAASASADMIEIKDEGIFNGTIESDEGDKVVFKEADGKERTLAKKDVLFMERQNEPPPAEKTVQKAQQALKKIVPPAKPAAAAPAKKKPASQPRKTATERLSSSSGGGSSDYTGALRTMAKAEKAIAASNARVEASLREGEAGKSTKKDAKKGHFSSL